MIGSLPETDPVDPTTILLEAETSTRKRQPMDDWENIVRQYTPLVWRTAYRLTGNHADASDCCQETFLSALVVSRREGVRNWAGLLRKLATTRALDRLRQRFREISRTEEVSDWAELPSGDPGPESLAEDSELRDLIRQALAKVPEQQAEVFCLRCVEELSFKEIADQLDMNPNTVRVLLHRARASLRESLAALTRQTEK
ncbi:MAG: sigma-70 family RNA polymerase sigma factor [Planctomycetes bacterium]|nr:sigma-70 family RNA polymerase sigma factor [Planctomycetota bacterium]